jgi:hypothetical protein
MVQELTQEIVKKLLEYDPETGILRWKISGHGKNIGQEAGGIHKYDKYKILSIYGKQYKYHRVAWLWFYGKWPENVIDHINGIKTDNRITNLRDVSVKINRQNYTKPTIKNKTGFLGVRKVGKKWYSSINVNSKVISLGAYKTPELAYNAYVVAKRQHHPGCTI